jgi:hypothetical protein
VGAYEAKRPNSVRPNLRGKLGEQNGQGIGRSCDVAREVELDAGGVDEQGGFEADAQDGRMQREMLEASSERAKQILGTVEGGWHLKLRR